MRLICFSLLLSIHFIAAETLSVSSPGQVLTVEFDVNNGIPRYQISRFGQVVIRPSRLGFIFKQELPLAWNLAVKKSAVSTFDETWMQPWGEQKNIRNHYNELRVELQEPGKKGRLVNLIYRVYDDGVGFRYEFPKQEYLKKFEIMDELTEFVMAGDHKAWWIPAYWGNRYEYLYRQTSLSQLDTVHTPITFETGDGLYLSIHEAALTDYSSMTLRRSGKQTLEADLVPWSDGTRVKGGAPMVTPWRTIQIADTPGDLITSYLILNLNEPNRLKDTSWIKPGKYVGVWWEMHLGSASWGSGDIHGATNKNVRRYIDFASKYKFDGVLVEGWNTGWDGDWVANGDQFNFTQTYPDFDMDSLSSYAAGKDVRLIGHHETGGAVENYEAQMEDAFRYYQKYGIRAVKTGYVGHGRHMRWKDKDGVEHREWHHGQYMVRHYRKAVETAAKYQIMLDVHEPIKDTGIRRTWPNMMTREGARGQEYDAWSQDGGNPPDHSTIIPFTRMLSGPMDFTPGSFDLLFPEARPENRVNTTLAKQLALYVVIYSPLHMASDLPENYEARPEAFQFIRDVPTDWAETRVVNARIGDYVTIARKDRNSDDWYLGSVSDENGRVLQVPLAFLDRGAEYTAQIYSDGKNADWITNPYAIDINQLRLNSGKTLNLRIAPGGGTAIRFIRL